ncbi:MAG: peptide ABC transporter substrate-binding protein [Acidimicrobiia bacterium]|nr:MAG: peptide ABC transporter substrate-binding protein [Acidimicrobiia bacterium]
MKRMAILLVVLALVAAACASGTGGDDTQTTTTAAPSGGGGDSTTTAPPTTTVPPTAEDAGGILTIGLFQEPDNLNPYLAVQTASQLVRELVLEGLVDADPEGNYIPQLAEVPSAADGTISEDGLTVTYKLRDGITWSDGDPFTSRDVQFTWEAIMNDANAVNSQNGYDKITSVTTPDPQTAVVTYSELFAPALSLFSIPEAILPAHVLEGQAFGEADFNRTPEGTGPYVVTEWNSGQSIILDKNPNYRVPDRPLIDRVIFKILPDQNAGIAQMRTGDIDVFWNLDSGVIDQFQNIENATIQVTPSSNIEYLGLNLSSGSDPANPHFAFSDARVRTALAKAIDRTPIINDLLFGLSEAATSPIGLGWAAPEGLTNPAYDPEGAKALLEEAGWVDSGDGIREKDGQRLTLEISTPAGQQVRELTEQVLQEQFKAVGIELVINNVPAATLFGNWAENGKLKRGDFDIVMDTWGADLDPDAFLSTLFRSDQIPNEANDGAGWNFFRLVDPTLDAAIDTGRSTLDIPTRKAAYRTVVERVLDAGVYLPLYKRSELDAFSLGVTGQLPNPWDDFTWNIEDWVISEG